MYVFKNLVCSINCKDCSTWKFIKSKQSTSAHEMGEKVNFNALTNVMQHLIGSCQILRWYMLRYTEMVYAAIYCLKHNVILGSSFPLADLWFDIAESTCFRCKVQGFRCENAKKCIKMGTTVVL